MFDLYVDVQNYISGNFMWTIMGLLFLLLFLLLFGIRGVVIKLVS